MPKSWAEVFMPKGRAVLEMTADQRARIFEILKAGRARVGFPGHEITKGEVRGDWLYFEYDNDENSNIYLPQTDPEYPAILKVLGE